MSYLIDTNVISEVRKGDGCDPNVARWYASVTADELHLSVLVLGEIRRGLELARNRNPQKAEALEKWLGAVHRAFEGRILGVDSAVAEEWGRMNAVRSLPIVDSLLAATAKVYDLSFVTRNTHDVDRTGVRLLNPFRA